MILDWIRESRENAALESSKVRLVLLSLTPKHDAIESPRAKQAFSVPSPPCPYILFVWAMAIPYSRYKKAD
jgi:hypothetical protein